LKAATARRIPIAIRDEAGPDSIIQRAPAAGMNA
jgi:hypothetical protein